MKIDKCKILTTDAQRMAFMHPVRSNIIGLLTTKPMTITQVAKELNVHPANLTHHFKKLENSKIIYLHEKKDIGRVVEKYYFATASNFEIDQVTDSANAKVLSFLKNDISKNITQLQDDDLDEVLGLLKWTKINKENFAEFTKKMHLLIKEYGNINDIDGDNYALNISLYPHRIDYGPINKMHINKKKRN